MTPDPNGPGDPDGRQGTEASGKRVPPYDDPRPPATILIDDRLTTTTNTGVISITSQE